MPVLKKAEEVEAKPKSYPKPAWLMNTAVCQHEIPDGISWCAGKDGGKQMRRGLLRSAKSCFTCCASRTTRERQSLERLESAKEIIDYATAHHLNSLTKDNII